MKVSILQGLNFESTYSIVIIECDSEPDTRLIDLVHSYHPIFLKDYSVKGKTIKIETRLPHVWRESALAINNVGTGKWSYEAAKDHMLTKVIRSQIYSMSTISLLEAAHELGLETTQVFMNEGIEYKESSKGTEWNKCYRIGIGRNSGVMISARTTRDPIFAKETQRDKKVTNTLISMMSLPIAKWEPIATKDELIEVFNDYRMPVVIKPTGLTQGHGVTTNIFDIDHALRAYDYAKEMIDIKIRPEWQRGVMIQEQVKGDDYRLLVIDGKLEIATKRVPAFVVGDGRSSIRELIEMTNTDPRRDLENPAHILKPIEFDKPLNEFLTEQGLTLDDVPRENGRVVVRKVASMSQGGITEDFTDKVHPQIKYLAESAASSIHANVVGIDVICLDISKPLTKENGSFIEMNTMPEIYLNTYPVIGDQHPDAGKKIVKGMLKGCEAVRTVIAVGKDLESLNEYLEQNGYFSEEKRTGVLSNGIIYINKERMSLQSKEIPDAVQALKLNALLSDIVIHYNDMDDVRKFGFGLNKFDLLLTDKSCEQTKTFEKKGLIGKIEEWN